MVLFFLFFSPTSNAAGISEGKDLVMQAIKQVKEGIIDKSIFITKNPPYMRARVVGETKAIGIYLFSSALHATDSLENKRLMDQATDIVVRGLVQMLTPIEQDEVQIFMQGAVNTDAEPMYMLLTFSSSAFLPEDYDFTNQTVNLISNDLIDKDALITEDGASLLIWASLIGNAEIVKDLLKIGANPNKARNGDGKTALIVASLNGYDEIVKVLLENMVEVDLTGEDGKTALMQASKKGYTGVAKMLLENRAIVDLTDKDGWTELMYASSNGYSKIAEMLLERGAAIDFIDKNGWTPLMLAVVNEHVEVVDMLVKKGANADLVNKDGCTASMLAARKGNVEIVKILPGKEVDLHQVVDKRDDFVNPIKPENKRDTELYVISYVSGSEFWSCWTEHYRLALQYEQISDILKNKLVCFFAMVFSDGKKEHGCMAPPA